jgi:hypothetical protein
MTKIPSYPSIFNLGHAAIVDLFRDSVILQEKVDGSQFSFGVRDGELFARSKGQQLIVEAPEKMFTKAIESIKSIQHLLQDGWTYRGEYLSSPHHNTLTYNRIPRNHIILYDIDVGMDQYSIPSDVELYANVLGLESVPTFYVGVVESFDHFMNLLDRESVLGGPKIEGVVIKNYARWGRDKRPLFGKYVRPEFKEQNSIAFRASNPTSKDIVQQVIATYRNDVRWNKAIQHLRDEGKLENSMRDIPALFREIPEDILKECREEIEKALWEWAWPKIRRGLTAGLPEYYQEHLAKSQFKKEQ